MPHTLACLLSISLALLSGFDTPADLLSHVKPRLDAFGDPLPHGVFYRLGTLRLRHQHVQTLIFSADGSQLLSQGATPDLRVWDVATGRILRQFAAAPEGRTHLIASPDDRYLACVRGNAYDVLLLDKTTGKELARWEHQRTWHGLTFSRDSKELVGLAHEGTVVKWSVADRKEISRKRLDMTKVDDKNPSSHWFLSPDGGIAAYKPSAAEGAPRMPWHFWDTATGKQCRPPLKAKELPDQVRWSPDGRMIAVVANDNTVQVWDTLAGTRMAVEAGRRQEKGSSYITRGVAFHPHGKLLAIAIDGSVAVWDVEAGKRLWGKQLSGDVLVFSPDGKTLAVGGSGIIWLLETATGERIGMSQRDPGWLSLAGWERSASFLNDGRSFTVHDQAGLSQIDIATGKRLRSYYSDKRAGFYYGGLCGDGRLFSCVGNDVHGAAQVFMFEAATGRELWRRPKQPSAIHFAADGKKLAVLSWNEDVFTLLDATTGGEIKKLSIPTYNNAISTTKAVSDDLRLAATTQDWRRIDLWDLATGKKVRSLECPPAGGHGTLVFLPGNEQLVGAIDRYFIDRKEKREWTRVWDVATGRIRRSYAEPVLKMSPDGRWLALQGDKGIALRHLQSGTLVATLDGFLPDAGFHILGFSPDGSLLAVRNATGNEVGLWDTFTGRRVCRWLDPLCTFDGVAFAPDGRTMVLTVRTGGSLLVCDVTGQATEPGLLRSQDLTPADAARAWLELTSVDGPRSHRARWRLVAGGQHTVELLRRCLRRVEPPDGKMLAGLMAGLESDNFKERLKSSQALEKMELARPALEDALQRNPSLEMTRRLELILAKQDGRPWDMELLRALRGVLLLEQIGTPSARELLQTLAGGAAGSLLTQEANAALQRLALAGELH